MVARKTRTAADKGRIRKLGLKKETLKDLNAKGAGKDVKGGLWGPVFPTVGCKTFGCPSTPYGVCGDTQGPCLATQATCHCVI